MNPLRIIWPKIEPDPRVVAALRRLEASQAKLMEKLESKK